MCVGGGEGEYEGEKNRGTSWNRGLLLLAREILNSGKILGKKEPRDIAPSKVGVSLHQESAQKKKLIGASLSIGCLVRAGLQHLQVRNYCIARPLFAFFYKNKSLSVLCVWCMHTCMQMIVNSYAYIRMCMHNKQKNQITLPGA